MANLIHSLRLEHELQLPFQNSELPVLSLGEEQATCTIEIAPRFHRHHITLQEKKKKVFLQLLLLLLLQRKAFNFHPCPTQKNY